MQEKSVWTHVGEHLTRRRMVAWTDFGKCAWPNQRRSPAHEQHQPQKPRICLTLELCEPAGVQPLHALQSEPKRTRVDPREREREFREYARRERKDGKQEGHIPDIITEEKIGGWV